MICIATNISVTKAGFGSKADADHVDVRPNCIDYDIRIHSLEY